MKVTDEMLRGIRNLALEGIAKRAPLAVAPETMLALLDEIDRLRTATPSAVIRESPDTSRRP